MTRKFLLPFGILSAVAFAASVMRQAQAHSQIYSQGVFSAGTTYYDISSTTLSLAPNKYDLREISWHEDTNGASIWYPSPGDGDISRRCLEVVSGSNDFYMPLDSGPMREFKSKDDPQPAKDSGNFASVFVQCLMDRGGRKIKNDLPTLQYNWVRGSLTNEDIFILPVDAFVPIKDFLRRLDGKPDDAVQPTIGAGGNCESINYTPAQVGVFLNLTRALDDNTIVSILGTQTPKQSNIGTLRANQ